MSKVTMYSNWCSIDRLDDINLKDKERLRVTWPNGVVEDYTIIVRIYKTSTRDHGTSCDISHSDAYINVIYNGLLIEVRLIGLEATRIKS